MFRRALTIFAGCASFRGKVTICAGFASIVLLAFAPSAWAAKITISWPGGGGCSTVGVWSGDATRTCTLTQDIQTNGTEDGIYITSDGITLDGNGHTVSGANNVFKGVFIQFGSPETVKNLSVTGFGYGIQVASTGTVNLVGNTVFSNAIGIDLSAVSNSVAVGNNIYSNSSHGVNLSASHDNKIKDNSIYSNGYGITVGSNSDWNTVNGNSLNNNTNYGIRIDDAASNSNLVITNNFANTNDAIDNGTNNFFYSPSGNYWRKYDSPAEGCTNISPFNITCDNPLAIGTNQDAGAFILRGGWNRFEFTWYDNVGGDNWVLIGNPWVPSADVWADLEIGSLPRELPALSGYQPGQIPAGTAVTPRFSGLRGGPVTVLSRDYLTEPVVSQRTLWPAGGDSLEEVNGTLASQLSSTLWWTWYDMLTPGFKNWILVSNPNAFSVTVNIFIEDSVTPKWSGQVPAGGQVNRTFTGVRGGPVIVQASDSGTGNPAMIMASQRVLTNNDKSFNEVPGIPNERLDDHYYWTWYDMTGGVQDWILIVNPPFNASNMYYEINIGGSTFTGGPIAPGGNLTPTFAGAIGGPVQVRTFSDPNNPGGTPLKSIAAQRVIWGPSFEEVPGFPSASVASGYNWTWYDQSTAGSQNWLLVANPNDNPPAAVSYDIKIGGVTVMDNEFIYPGVIKYYQFPGIMAGPVQVLGDNPLVVSQRVLWNNHLNEVGGQ